MLSLVSRAIGPKKARGFKVGVIRGDDREFPVGCEFADVTADLGDRNVNGRTRDKNIADRIGPQAGDTLDRVAGHISQEAERSVRGNLDDWRGEGGNRRISDPIQIAAAIERDRPENLGDEGRHRAVRGDLADLRG